MNRKPIQQMKDIHIIPAVPPLVSPMYETLHTAPGVSLGWSCRVPISNANVPQYGLPRCHEDHRKAKHGHEPEVPLPYTGHASAHQSVCMNSKSPPPPDNPWGEGCAGGRETTSDRKQKKRASWFTHPQFLRLAHTEHISAVVRRASLLVDGPARGEGIAEGLRARLIVDAHVGFDVGCCHGRQPFLCLILAWM